MYLSCLQAKINIARPSARTVRRMNESSEFSKDTKIQVFAKCYSTLT